MLNRHLCEHRYDYKQGPFYMKFFRENYDLFELAYMTEVNGKRFMFSHAGLSKYWLKNNEQFFGTDVSDPEKILALLDNGLKIYKRDIHNDGGDGDGDEQPPHPYRALNTSHQQPIS